MIFVHEVPKSSGQERIPSSRKPACGCYVCGLLLAVNFPDKAPNCAGILATDACPVEMAELPVEKRRAFCKEIKARSKDQSLDGCLNLRGACEDVLDDPPGPDCEKPTPWFDRSTQCTDVQSPVVRVTGKAVTVSMCGLQIFRSAPSDFDDLMLKAYSDVIKESLRDQIGEKICCSSMREATRTGQPCDPAADIDCDGKPNSSDLDTTSVRGAPLPDIDLAIVRTGTAVDPFPPGLDRTDPNFRPERTAHNSKGVGDCPCKWELTKGNLACSKNGRDPHLYSATWRCPTTKAEVTTSQEIAATKRCEKKASRGSLPISLSESLELAASFNWPE